jgi:KDO2-lipid IV(A) lauroyltransferase
MTSAPGAPNGVAPAAPPGTTGENGNGNGGQFRAPHRRAAREARIREWAVVTAYSAGSWVLGRLPFGPTVRVGGWIAVAVYRLWPEKRRYVRANAARILGRPVGDPRVDALARAVFRNQVRWVVEGMHLVRTSREEHVRNFDGAGPDLLHAAWEASDGLILAGLHIGNGEAAAAALAGRGWPMHVLADDTAYDGLFERFSAQRRAWGVEVIRWRNLRHVYRVLRNREILGLLVDWGYRPDGQVVRFLGGWTTLPSGPAVLAARTGATILPFWTLRRPDGTFVGEVGEPILVASSEPAEIARATQAIADALEVAVREAPEQWCVFKPMWPADPAEEAALAARARGADVLEATSGPASAPASSAAQAPFDAPEMAR